MGQKHSDTSKVDRKSALAQARATHRLSAVVSNRDALRLQKRIGQLYPFLRTVVSARCVGACRLVCVCVCVRVRVCIWACLCCLREAALVYVAALTVRAAILPRSLSSGSRC